ncbi:AAA family ATPase [Streptomyces variegatus]|uniref:AAA family ATPase n=1 Tax=Streptomyces variegatus TaxID=284040 RepID=UPI003C2C00A2
MTTVMKGFRCWSAGSVSRTVYSDIGALPTHAEALFLAAHTPMGLSHPRGEELPDAGSDERQVLDTLLAAVGDMHRNTLIAVTGESGAGKSHVVRWVHARLDPSDERYHVLYVPRAVQSIRELLRRIVAGLPGGGGQEFMDRIDEAVGNSTPAELQDRLLEEMRLALTWTLELQLPGDDESDDQRAAREERNSLLGDPDERGKRRNGLADLLSLDPVNRTLLRDGGRLHQFIESVYKETSRRDDGPQGFTAPDLPLREAGVRRELTGNGDLRDLWDLVRQDPKPALDILDEALRQAVPRTLGLKARSGETLDLLFRRSRQVLREKGKELLLVFEDLAQFGLIDGELYDQFVTQPGSDLAPLRVLFAVTDAPFSKLPETVRTRITHQFAVNSSALTDRKAFVARYLNLARVGRDNVERSWTQAQKDTVGEEWVPNACDTRENGLPCRFRDECHQGFGAVQVQGLGSVGLYPYNEASLRRALSGASLRRIQNGQGSEPTPREVLDTCVAEVLREADPHIERGTYPHPRVRELFDFKVQRPKDALLQGATGEPAERLYRTLVIWGDEEDLAPAVVDAFSLGGSTARKRATPPPDAEQQRPKQKENPEKLQKNPLLPLFQWQNGERLPDHEADTYRASLYRLVSSRLELDQDLFHVANGRGAQILSGLFTRYSFDLEDARGRTAGPESVRFEVRRQADDVQVLMGARWFADHGHWRPQEGNWAWPEGYDPAELMLSLESRLDQWAEAVRQSFRNRVRGRGLARAAIGVRAVALLATGVTPDRLRTVDNVLSTNAPSSTQSTTTWGSVDRAAQKALRQAPAAEDWVGEFASVRQGDTGAAQLVDAADLEKGLQETLKSPAAFLRHTLQEFNDVAPELAISARELLSSIQQASPAHVREVITAIETLAESLEGEHAQSVARSAQEVGRQALTNQFFRPDNGWGRFSEAVQILESLPELPLDWRRKNQEEDEEEALAIQPWAREAVAGAEALEVVRQSLEATSRECLRSDAAGGDLNQLRQDVQNKLGQIEQYLQTLSTTEAGHG